ncbi:anthranilate synthase component I family protein [Candidatus Gottesmanbacteria bacterium]|nr:anthranilate synthase component I family protein [Candidatus Gottesmanbacteria bacterium]
MDIFQKIHLGKYREEEIDIPLSAFEAFKRLYGNFRTMFLLESLGEEGKYNRYSYVGFDPTFLIHARGKNLTINGKSYEVTNPYRQLSTFTRLNDNAHDFSGGLVGYISYEGTQYFEKAFTPKSNREFSDFAFGFYPDGLKFDKKTRRCIYFHHGQSRRRMVLGVLHGSGDLQSFSFKTLASQSSQKHHSAIVAKAKQEIKKGNIFQVVLSVRTNYHLFGDTRRLYAAIRSINPSPYMSYLKFGEQEILSASPELLIRVKGRYIEHFGTLAGTISRGESEKEDEKLAVQLKADEKEMAEHMMLVDLARNDVGKICKFGSISIDKLASVKPYSHVQHLYSEIRGRLRENETVFSALAACFPAGTLTGAPKIEAMKIINSLESEPRGPYGGVIGYASLNGEAMFSIAIRSIFAHGQYAYTQTGSGIVLDSKVTHEYQEIINKQKAMEEALRLAQGE